MLVDLGYDVLVATRQPGCADPRADVVNIDVLNYHKDDLFEQVGSPDVCIHLAWSNGFQHNSTEHMKNLSSHYDFCRRIMEGGIKIMNCLGSMHEVGYWEGEIDENTPCNPLSQYGISKNALRESLMLESKQHDCAFNWLRGFYIVSDDTTSNSIFSKIILASQKGQTHFPMNSGKNLYDFMDLDEFLRLLVKACFQREVTGIINICTGKPVSLSSCIESFINKHNIDIQLDYGSFPERPYDSPGIWGNPDKINRIDELIRDVGMRGV